MKNEDEVENYWESTSGAQPTEEDPRIRIVLFIASNVNFRNHTEGVGADTVRTNF